MIDTTSQEFFDCKYRENSDPWNFSSSDYEQSRYRCTFSALSHKHYRHAFEPGCSIGSLTELIAPLCDRIDAIDISPTAVDAARERCRHLPQVHFACGALPDAIPKSTFDLLVLSEIGYYFTAPQFEDLASNLASHLESNGVLLAVHWLGNSEDHLLSGDDVHRILSSLPGLKYEYGERHAGFRLDRWCR